jgi:peptide/nickel transport system permease protein
MSAMVLSAPITPTRSSLRRRIPVAPLLFLLTSIVVVLFGANLSRHDPNAIALSDRLVPPILFGGTSDHILGTDGLGRDVLARLLAGARISLLIALASTVLAGGLGVMLGVVAGYMGGRWDALITWLSDIQMAIPFVVVAIALAATIAPSAGTVVLVLGLTGWATYARVARLSSRPLRTAGFVESARVSGAGDWLVVFRHVLPVISPALIVIACQQAGAMLLYESALSFLGLGVPADTITWGGMVADSRETAQVAWWVTFFPGMAIVVVVFGFNSIGRWMNQRLGGL